jgi:hypothetical protein
MYKMYAEKCDDMIIDSVAYVNDAYRDGARCTMPKWNQNLVCVLSYIPLSSFLRLPDLAPPL